MFFLKKYKHYVSICAIIRDETPYIEEWVDYHRKTGVSHFFIYDNESEAPVRETAARYIDEGLMTVIDFPGKKMQLSAYQHCIDNYKATSRWIAFIDTDEFIVPKSTNGNLKEFLKDYEQYGGLGVNWLLFGSGGRIHRSEKSQLESFTLRGNKEERVNEHIKTIVQTRYVKRVSVDPHSFVYRRWKYCVNENFNRVDGPFSKNSTDKIQLNHYYCRSLEEYHQKIKRGRADTDVVIRTLNDFYDHDKDANAVEDRSILQLFKD